MEQTNTLKQLIEDGERRLAEVEDPAEREELRAKMFNNLCRRFPQFQGLLVIDGEVLEPVSKKDVEDKIIQDHYDKLDDKDASDFAEEGCYRDDEDDSEPRLRGMMRGPNEKDFGQTFIGAPAAQVMPYGIVDFSAPTAVPDAVGQGQVWEDNIRDDSTPDEYTGGAHRIKGFGSGGRAFRVNPKAIHPKTCEMCNVEFKGTEGARYCNECRSPKYCKMRRDAKAAEKFAATVVTPAKSQDVRAVVSNFLRHGEKTTEQLRDALQEAGVDVTEVTK